MRIVKRALGVLAALAVLVGAAGATRVMDARRAANARTDVARGAAALRDRTTDLLRIQVKSLEIRASAAADLQALKAQLALLRNNSLAKIADTLTDWFSNEPQWEPFRKEFPVYGLAVDGDDLGFAMGIEPKQLASQLLVRQAREQGLASDTVMGNGWPHAATAARIVMATTPGKPAVLVLARPFDEALLRMLAQQVGGALLLSDGKKALSQVGSAQEIERLSSVIGQETAAEPPSAPGGSWAATAISIGPRLWLWAHAAAEGSARDTGSSASRSRLIVWSAAAAIAMLLVVVAFRRPPLPATVPATATMAASASAASSSLAPATELPVSGVGATIQAAGAVPPPTGSRPVTNTAGRPVAPQAGQPFGRYTLLEQLGEGGMAQVYTAVTFGAEGFRRKFVVKRLRPELASTAAAVAQFTDEANLASSLVHSNVIPVFDFGKVGEEYFLATEYILGRDLGRVVGRLREREGCAMSEDLVLYCALETLKALDYAHTKTGEAGRPLGIVHRDVSPNNVLVSARGEVKLFDFGIVKAEGRVTQTQHGVVKGNVSFMSPEQARGVEVDARADLFSMGLVMYYCLTGEVLYEGNTTYELLFKAAAGPGADELPRLQRLPPATAAIIGRALAVNPAQRYGSAAEFVAALAPLVRTGGKELADLVQRLFAEDFRDEEKRFSSAVAGSGSVAAAGTPSTQSNVRRS